MDDEKPPQIDFGIEPVKPKPPRKPRPSEIAAKKAKLAAGKTTPKSRAKLLKKAKARKPKAKKLLKRIRKHAKQSSTIEKTARLDMRVTKTLRAKIMASAKRQRRTITSVVMEALEKIR